MAGGGDLGLAGSALERMLEKDMGSARLGVWGVVSKGSRYDLEAMHSGHLHLMAAERQV